MTLSPLKMILIGFILMVLGVILPFLMVLHIIASTFFLNFFSYTASLVGLILGLIGSAYYVRLKKKK
jgi:heme/copper-type cytochrome/quinol oxidase subunit 4